MSNALVLNKEAFIQKFLTPISRVTSNATITTSAGILTSVSASQDAAIVLLVTFATADDIAVKEQRMNIPDIKKFIRLLECIDNDKLDLQIKNNCIVYSTSNLNFKYFLLEDNYMQKCPVNPDKVKALNYDTTFQISQSKFNEVLKGSSIATDTDKLYIQTSTEGVVFELNDFERQNINCISYMVCETYEGSPIASPVPFNLEHIRLLAGLRGTDFTVKINNQLKVALFEIKDESAEISFIISALVK